MIMSEKEKRNTAVHEAGHALVGKLLPGCDPVHKVTIIPRGQALGLTWSLPAEDQFNRYKKQMLDQISMLLGGRIAEELMFDEMSAGASNDIERATQMARAMVCRWGMSEKLGPLAFGQQEGEVFLGRDLGSRPDYSESTARDIDGEVRRIVMDCYEKAKGLLSENKAILEKIAEALVEYETIEAEDLNVLIQGGTITRAKPQSRITAAPKKEKEKRKILDALEGLGREAAGGGGRIEPEKA
jgi:cell division protease FtsH